MLLNYNSQQSALKTVLDGAVNIYQMQNNLLQNCEISSFLKHKVLWNTNMRQFGNNLIIKAKIAQKFVKNRKQKHLVNNFNETSHLYLRYFHFHCFYQCGGHLNNERGS